jgi:hypothetical protein
MQRRETMNANEEASATVTIVTAGDISVTRAADGKTAVSIKLRSRQSEIRRRPNYDKQLS